ncbi:hypothetical protein Hanom_Chr08g00706811 [Helianthus anomalus]
MSDNEMRSNNRPPKLFHLNNYPYRKGRFKTHVLGQNAKLWLCFFNPFTEALEEAGSNPITVGNLCEADKKAYDLENKAFAILTQALKKTSCINLVIVQP